MSILFEKSKLPRLPDGEWYHHQLLGLPVRSLSGKLLGKITQIVVGEVDVWVAENEDEILYIPHTDDEIISVDLENGVVVSDGED